MELTQTLKQKETARLLSNFFKRRGNFMYRKIYESTGVKLDKPFFMGIHKGIVDTKELLKKYPLSDNQEMFIVVLYKEQNHYTRLEDTHYCMTRVFDTGKISTRDSRSWGEDEEYLADGLCHISKTVVDFGKARKRAYKTLVIVADRSNIVPRKNRIDKEKCAYRILNNLDSNPASTRVNVVGISDEFWFGHTIRVTLRGSSYVMGIDTKIKEPCPIDHSGYILGYFRRNLMKRLKQYKNFMGARKVLSTDYSSSLQRIYDEMTVLKNLLGSAFINATDTEVIGAVNNLIYRVSKTFVLYDDIKEIFDSTIAVCNGVKVTNSGYFSSDKEVKGYLSRLENDLNDIKQELFDYLQQADI